MLPNWRLWNPTGDVSTIHQDNVVYQTARADLLDLEALGFLDRSQVGRQYRFYPAPGLSERLLGL
jgi:hypothetical protein